MARRAKLINAFTKGAIDPRLHERIDLKHYYTGLRTAKNVLVRPQGGFRRSPGTLLRQRRIRRQLEPVNVTGSMITAPNGGTAANLVDGNDATMFTTAAVSGATHVVAEVDLGTARPIVFVDVERFSGASGSYQDAIVVEYWDGATWISMPGAEATTYTPRKNLRTTARTRRFGGRPGLTFSARYWRVVVYTGAGPGAITVGGLRFWVETARLSPARFVPVARSLIEHYEGVLTDLNLDLFEAGRYVGSVPILLPAADITAANWETSLDTVFFFHEDLDTPRVQRQGAGDEWDIARPTWTNVPTLTASTAFSGDNNEWQDLTFPVSLQTTDSIILLFGSQQAAPFLAGTSGDLPGRIVTALTALSGMPSGVAAELLAVSPAVVRVRFEGSAGARRWPKIDARIVGATTAVSTVVMQRGVKASGKLMDVDTGWPRAGALAQSRLFVGGFRAAPATFMASRNSNLFDFQKTATPQTADLAVEYTIDSDQVETINELFLGRHMLLFTEAGEWWIENRAYDATQPMNVILATRHALAPQVPLAMADGGVLFMQQDGLTLRDMLYGNVEENYGAEPMSLLGPHLLTGVVSLAHKKAVSVNEGNLVWLVNADGTMAMLTLLRSQDVIAMTQRTTRHGSFRDAMVDVAGGVWLLVERAGEIALEQWDETSLFDSAVRYSGAPTTTVTGLGHLETRQVWALADGDVYGPFTVTGAAITLPIAASSITAGLDIDVDVETLPLREQLQNGEPFRPPGRIYEVELSMIGTGGVALSVNAGPIFEVPLRNHDGGPPPVEALGTEPTTDTLDTPMMDRLYTGTRILDGLLGWSQHPRIRITQTYPAPLEIRAIRYEIAY